MSINQTNLKISALICFLTFVCQAFAQDLEFKFLNFHYYETFYDTTKNQLLESYLNKEFETIFKFTDSGIIYSSQFTENGKTISMNLMDSYYEDIIVTEHEDGHLSINFTPFETFISVTPLGEISFFDSLLESDFYLYKESESYKDLESSEVPSQNLKEFLRLAQTLYEKELLNEEEYLSLINTLTSD